MNLRSLALTQKKLRCSHNLSNFPKFPNFPKFILDSYGRISSSLRVTGGAVGSCSLRVTG